MSKGVKTMVRVTELVDPPTLRAKDNPAKVGDTVWANLDGDVDNSKLGLLVDLAGDKDQIQVGDQFHFLAYRAPKDREGKGPGRTWWTLSQNSQTDKTGVDDDGVDDGVQAPKENRQGSINDAGKS